MLRSIEKILNRKSIFNCIALICAISIIIGFCIGNMSHFPDEVGYLNMAKSIGKGTFSSWYFLNTDVPETLRTWGYPYFIHLIQIISYNVMFVKIAQLIFYFISVLIVLKLIQFHTKDLLYRSLFLLLLTPNIQLAYYTGQIVPEGIATFFVVLFIFIWYTWPKSTIKFLLLAFTAFVLFQLRPAFLLFPIIFFLIEFFYQKNYGLACLFLFTYGLLLLPFGFWNKKHHGIFKVTPLEGGAGISHLGYWSFRLPAGYKDTFYWNHWIYKDIFQPQFYSESEQKASVVQYNNEWVNIENRVSKYLTRKDSIVLEEMKAYPSQFPVYNSAYTIQREKILWEFTKEHIRQDLGRYIATRIYTFFRIWFTGINTDFYKASFKQKVSMLYPFIITFVFILGGLFTIAILFIKRILDFKLFFGIFIFIIYLGCIHNAFSIQSRYTVPVHILILFLLAIGIGNMLCKKKDFNVSNRVLPI